MTNILAISRLVIKEIFRKKDFYVAFIFMGIVLFYAAHLRFYNVGNTYRYLMDIGLGLSYVFAAILSATLSARQFPSEIQNKTCQVLLSKSVTRWEFVFGKFLGSFLAGSACFILFFATLLAFTLTKTTQIAPYVAFQACYLFCLGIMILTALCMFFSFFMTTASNVSISLTLFMIISIYGVTLKQMAEKLSGASRVLLELVNLVIPHFGFFDMRQRLIHGWGGISGALLLLLTGYAAAYSFLFLFLGWLLFRRKNIA